MRLRSNLLIQERSELLAILDRFINLLHSGFVGVVCVSGTDCTTGLFPGYFVVLHYQVVSPDMVDCLDRYPWYK